MQILEVLLKVFLSNYRNLYLLLFFASNSLNNAAFTLMLNTVKPLNSEHLRVLKNLSVVERCPLLRGNLTKIVTFGTKRFVRYSRHVRYLGCPLLGGFKVFNKMCWGGFFFAKFVSIFWNNSLWNNERKLIFNVNKRLFTNWIYLCSKLKWKIQDSWNEKICSNLINWYYWEKDFFAHKV